MNILKWFAGVLASGNPPRLKPGTWVRALLVSTPMMHESADTTVEGLLIGYARNGNALVRESQDGETFQCIGVGVFPLPDPTLPETLAWITSIRHALQKETGPWKH